MSTSPAKDFGPIADDYVFFEEQSTEAREDVVAHADSVQRDVPADGPIRMLDFGCGSGSFTARFLARMSWPTRRLQVTLVEPVESVRRQAVTRIAKFTDAPVANAPTMPRQADTRFDVILANHVFYYVPDLTAQLENLVRALSHTGVLTTAIADRRNTLIEFWIAGFALLDMEVPYYTSENVEAALRALRTNYEKLRVPYELAFADTEENRLRILRFLFADYLCRLPRQTLLDQFDQYHHAGQILIRTASDHFVVRAEGRQDRASGD